ncbi:MAG: NADH-quinone oxidoreductase subunit J [Desulfatirhabdiaceae bacterium]
MTIYTSMFYLLAAIVLATTTLAITRRHLVHAVMYLVMSFFGSAMLFYLLGAPYLAALQVIVYAGAIMVLFLFIVMMMDVRPSRRKLFPLNQWLPAASLGCSSLILGGLMLATESENGICLTAAQVEPAEFGRYLFQSKWLAIEIASLLLLVALVGALLVGRNPGRFSPDQTGDIR